MHYSTPRIFWTVIATIIFLLIVIEAVRLVYLYRSVKGYKTYWEEQIAKPATPGDFIYLALGDSVAQGIGASSPQKSYVGQIAQHIEKTTGRKVHIINISVTGAIASEVVTNQLPRIKNLKPDLVTLDIGANDINKKIPAAEFENNFRIILAAIPTKKTIVADLPTFERGPKQETLIAINNMIHPIIAEYGFKLSPIYDFTSATIHDWTTYAADFFHPSDKGYRNWYNAFATKLDSTINNQNKMEQSAKQ